MAELIDIWQINIKEDKDTSLGLLEDRVWPTARWSGTNYSIKDSNEIVSSMYCYIEKDYVYVDGLVTKIGEERKGYGTLLLDYANTLAKNNTLKSVKLHLEESRNQFYLNRGFVLEDNEHSMYYKNVY